MKKCECYHVTERVVYDPLLQQKRFIEYDGECWGTKEKDICYCKGDKRQCDFYPAVRGKAKREYDEEVRKVVDYTNKQHILKTLKWYLDIGEENGVVYIPKFAVEKMIEELEQ